MLGDNTNTSILFNRFKLHNLYPLDPLDLCGLNHLSQKKQRTGQSILHARERVVRSATAPALDTDSGANFSSYAPLYFVALQNYSVNTGVTEFSLSLTEE